MNPFVKASVIDESRMTAQQVMQAFPQLSLSEAEQQLAIVREEERESDVLVNDEYQVVRRRMKGDAHGLGALPLVHLSIKRLDRAPIHDWRALQEIKNLLVGPECEALELYPAESRLVDTANQYHLWVIDDPHERIPVGWRTRNVSDVSIARAVQRPRDPKIVSAALDPMRERFTARFVRNAGGTEGYHLYPVNLSVHGEFQLYRNEAEALYLSLRKALLEGDA